MDREEKCKFCYEYESLKKIKEKSEREMAKLDLPVRDTFTASIQIHRERLGWGQRDAGIITYRTHPLKYCPVCGKKLEE